MALLTLVPADAPEDAPSARWEIAVTLDREGRIDPAAWLADPAPWRARLTVADGTSLEGDLQSEGDDVWQIRAPAMPDAPIHSQFRPGGKLVLGGILTLRLGSGTEESWRVVGLG